MKIIKVYATRIEIEPYKKGENPQLEFMCSTKRDKITHRRGEIGFRIEGNTFIGPRGLSLAYLSKYYDAVPIIEQADEYAKMKKAYKLKTGPRNDDQKKAISFLLGINGFEKSRKYSQLSLNTYPEFGKTYCATFAMVAFQLRTIIIVHRATILNQWLKTFEEKTNIDMKRVCVINGSKGMKNLLTGKKKEKYDIYLILHNSLGSYLKSYGSSELRNWFRDMKFGLKITDEAHLYFAQTVETDLYSNVAKTFYLSATFRRSDYKEVDLFKQVFANTIRYGEELKKKKHIIYTICMYNSAPTLIDKNSIHISRGTSATKWADYAFSRDQSYSIFYEFEKRLKEAFTYEGKLIILIPKIDYCELICEFVKKKYPWKEVGTVHSKNTKKKNAEVLKNADVIVTTISGSGTGLDDNEIRTMIIMSPYSSTIIAQQLPERLRQFRNIEGEDSYVWELLDCGFEALVHMMEARYKVLEDVCKEVRIER